MRGVFLNLFPSAVSQGEIFLTSGFAATGSGKKIFSLLCADICEMSKPNSTVVLIIDDEPDICFLLSNLLKQQKLNPLIASTLAEGMKMLKHFSPALLFLDIQLPDGSGLDALRSIKDELPEIKIIMMSAYDGEQEQKIAMDAGVTEFLSKPLSFDLVSKTLRKVIFV